MENQIDVYRDRQGENLWLFHDCLAVEFNLMPVPRDNLQISDLSIESINQVLAIIQERLDDLKGLRNEVVIYDVINAKEAGVKVEDTNGTTIHGFGDI